MGARPQGNQTKQRDYKRGKAFVEENDGSWFCLVVERAYDKLIGFAKGKRSDNPGYAGELNKIYLLRDYQRTGLGRRLVGFVVRRFWRRASTRCGFALRPDNPSCAFYEALGEHNLTDADGKTNYGNHGWSDLWELMAKCPVD